MGMTARQVQRHIAALEEKKLIARIPRFDPGNGGRSTNMYDLTGLVAQLQALEPDFRKVESDVKQNRRAVQKRTYRRAAAQPAEKASS
jgi:predicted ArsR family transcriptional regulator